MDHRRLGRSGLKVSTLALGSWTTFGGSVDEADAVRIIRRAFDAGVNLFDTADVYGDGAAETVLGRALRDLPREQLVIATKCRWRMWAGPLGEGLSRKHVFDALDHSLRRLGVDYVDLYQMHSPDSDTPLEESLRAFEDLVRSGKVRHVGYSNFDHHAPLDRRALEIQRANGWDLMISSQPCYNLVDRHVEKSHLSLCRRFGLGMLVYSSLAQGVLTNKYAGGRVPPGTRASGAFGHFLTSGKALTPENVIAAERLATWCARTGAGTPAQVAIAWALRRPQVASVILGATSEAQLNENLLAVDLRLSDAEWRDVEAAIAAPPRTHPARAAGRRPRTARRATRTRRSVERSGRRAAPARAPRVRGRGR
jgi:aryl-alcohol dehydrogenase-like predicted oxidoreductase